MIKVVTETIFKTGTPTPSSFVFLIFFVFSFFFASCPIISESPSLVIEAPILGADNPQKLRGPNPDPREDPKSGSPSLGPYTTKGTL